MAQSLPGGGGPAALGPSPAEVSQERPDRCGGSRFQLSALRRPLGATGATVVDLLGLERTLTALHQHGHQHFLEAGCHAEGVQSRPVGGTTEPVPLCQIAAVTPSFQEFFENSNPIRVVRFRPLSPPLPHRIQFLFASSTPPIPRVQRDSLPIEALSAILVFALHLQNLQIYIDLDIFCSHPLSPILIQSLQLLLVYLLSKLSPALAYHDKLGSQGLNEWLYHLQIKLSLLGCGEHQPNRADPKYRHRFLSQYR